MGQRQAGEGHHAGEAEDGTVEGETEDAIEDHNKLRNAVKAVEKHAVGTKAWFEAVGEANVVNSNGAMKTAIGQDPNAIGYVGIGHLDKSIKGVSVDGMAPSQENAASGQYTVTRLLYMNTKGEPQGLIAAFVRYIIGPEGAQMTAAAGYLPLSGE